MTLQGKFMKLKTWLILLPIAFTALPLPASEVILVREPDLPGDTLVFTYARDIWETSLSGGEVTRITSFADRANEPPVA